MHSPKFTDGERVLCFHGPLIYEGKVLKLEFREKEQKYYCFIHYAGWNKSWDEFVPEDRVLKYSEENLLIQKNHKIAHEAAMRASRKSAAKTSVSTKKKGSLAGESTGSSGGGRSDSRASTPNLETRTKKVGSTPTGKDSDEEQVKKRKLENVEPEQIYVNKQEIKITFPDPVKNYLVEDWDRVCRLRQVARIPAPVPVNKVIEDFLKSQPSPNSVMEEFCTGLKDYFNVMLSNQLLYRYERQQMLDLLNSSGEDVEYSSLYGIPHLMRLLTKIGSCVAITSLSPEGVQLLQNCVDEFLGFTVKNQDQYLTAEAYQTGQDIGQQRVGGSASAHSGSDA